MDALRQVSFPTDEIGVCPLSGHCPAGARGSGRVGRIPDNLKADAVVVDNADKAVFRLKTGIGDSTRCQFQGTGLDGSVYKALRQSRASRVEPSQNWLAATSDGRK